MAPFVAPPPPPPQTPFPTFNCALQLARKLDVRPSIETLKTLEVAEITASLDPHPSKHARKEKSQPRGEIQGQEASPSLAARIGSAADKGKEKEKVRDDEVISCQGKPPWLRSP